MLGLMGKQKLQAKTMTSYIIIIIITSSSEPHHPTLPVVCYHGNNQSRRGTFTLVVGAVSGSEQPVAFTFGGARLCKVTFGIWVVNHSSLCLTRVGFGVRTQYDPVNEDSVLHVHVCAPFIHTECRRYQGVCVSVYSSLPLTLPGPGYRSSRDHKEHLVFPVSHQTTANLR
ncbi:hypothetical protein JOB18_048475 [Solea senegalensis]|uniref:Uncharacterized protein n=1 Tax=Solea senegalensis TaxID=28829 RepID=A0AAV6TD58_SOLSE|nr:hypothetical protein JOB18_048475 [Solea senegalensis]